MLIYKKPRDEWWQYLRNMSMGLGAPRWNVSDIPPSHISWKRRYTVSIPQWITQAAQINPKHPDTTDEQRSAHVSAELAINSAFTQLRDAVLQDLRTEILACSNNGHHRVEIWHSPDIDVDTVHNDTFRVYEVQYDFRIGVYRVGHDGQLIPYEEIQS